MDNHVLRAAQAAGPWNTPAPGSRVASRTALIVFPDPFLAMRDTLTEDEMVAKLMECERKSWAEEFSHLNSRYDTPRSGCADHNNHPLESEVCRASCRPCRWS